MKPSAPFLDLRPIARRAPVELVRDADCREVFVMDGSKGLPDDVASDEAVALLVDEGVLSKISCEEFNFYHYWDSVDEMVEFISSNWGDRTVIPPSEEFDVVRRAYASSASGTLVRITRPIRLCAYALSARL